MDQDHVNQITLNFAPRKAEGITSRDFDSIATIEQPDSAPLTFYVAINQKGEVVGSVQINPVDRKAVAALAAGWIAAGYAVHRKTYKDLNKLLRAAQQARDAENAAENTANKEASEENGPVFPFSDNNQSGA